MPTMYGTLNVMDTLAAANNQSVIQYGEENLAGLLQQLLDAHNRLVGDVFETFVGFTTDRLTSYGTNMSAGQMVDVDEYGVADAQKLPFAQDTIGFPLRRKQFSLQWTGDYLKQARPIELANQVMGATDADILSIYSAIRTALFTPTDNLTYVDRLTDGATIPLKALINADGAILPPHPITGATFNGATHTHYLATASLTEANYLALVETIREHGLVGPTGKIIVAIPKTMEAAVRAFSGFVAYTDPRIVYSTAANRADRSVDILQLEDRALGFDGVAEIWVKPWMPDNYMLAYLRGGIGKPLLGFRTPSAGPVMAGVTPVPAENPMLAAGAPSGRDALGALRIVAQFDRYPLHAETMERTFGVSVWNRLNGAVLYTGGGSYVTPAGL